MAQLKRSKRLNHLSVYTCEAIPCHCESVLLAERPLSANRKAFRPLFGAAKAAFHDHVPSGFSPIRLARFWRYENHRQLSKVQHVRHLRGAQFKDLHILCGRSEQAAKYN